MGCIPISTRSIFRECTTNKALSAFHYVKFYNQAGPLVPALIINQPTQPYTPGQLSGAHSRIVRSIAGVGFFIT